jgi:hypothetical protein
MEKTQGVIVGNQLTISSVYGLNLDKKPAREYNE